MSDRQPEPIPNAKLQGQQAPESDPAANQCLSDQHPNEGDLAQMNQVPDIYQISDSQQLYEITDSFQMNRVSDPFQMNQIPDPFQMNQIPDPYQMNQIPDPYQMNQIPDPYQMNQIPDPFQMNSTNWDPSNISLNPLQANFAMPDLSDDHLVSYSGPYDDDQAIPIPNISEESKRTTTNSSNLISISSEIAFNCLELSATQTQEVPCVLTLESKRLSESTKPSNIRPGIDLVCVIDKSGSMRNENIDLVKQTLHFMVEQLQSTDRVCLITFNSAVERLCPLTVASDEGKMTLNAIIEQIQVSSTTNIIGGLRCGLEMLAGRRMVNSVSAILLLSDGKDDHKFSAFQRAQKAYTEIDVPGGFVVHSFGYGKNHDVELLNAIPEQKNGDFYYVQDDQTIAEAFSNCLGELVSVVADQIEVRLVTTPCPFPFSMVKVYSESGDSSFRMPSLLSDNKKEAVFLLGFLPYVGTVPENCEISPVRGTVKYRVIETGNIEEQEFALTFYVKNEGAPGELEIKENVMVNFYRVKAADILKEASALGDAGEHQKARDLLQKGSLELTESIVATHPLIQVLINDLANSVNKFKDSHTWNFGGKAAVKAKAQSHWAQRGEEVDMYQNFAQMELNFQAKNAIKKR